MQQIQYNPISSHKRTETIYKFWNSFIQYIDLKQRENREKVRFCH